LVPSIIVNINCDAAQSGDFAGELVELGVVLAFAFVGFGHGGSGDGGSFGDL